MSKHAVLFPGQGAQKVGMAADFVEGHALAREFFDRANETLGYDLAGICLNGPDETLTLTCHCQPAIYLVSAAIAAVAEAEGKLDPARVACVAGLSLGEFTALYWAGVYSFEDGLRLVARRGDAMQKASDAPPSGMVSLIGADEDQAHAIAAAAAEGEVLVVANLLSPGQIVLSGTRTACARVPEVAKGLGVRRAIPLNVAGAFHSPLMAPAAAELKEALDAVEMRAPRVPVVANVSAAMMTDPASIRAASERQIVEPVRWVESMQTMIAAGVETFVEPGPGKVLAGLMKKIDKDRGTINYDQVADLAG
ncbi:MAG: ACP S-malonyltransferase [Planctomycetes bacterium]|nr:ACP S-malonyltransferase [Planctomycetota bacterium]